MIKLFKNEQVEVVKAGAVLSSIKKVGAEDCDIFTVRTAALKEPKKPRLSSVEKALATDPAVLTELLPFVLRIEVSASPASVDTTALDISENSELSELEALDYIRVVTDRSHAAKFDIIVNDSIPAELRDRSKVFFNENGHRAHDSELQIGSKSLALWLLDKGIRPVSQAAR